MSIAIYICSKCGKDILITRGFICNFENNKPVCSECINKIKND